MATVPVHNYSSLRGPALENLARQVERHVGLGDALAWARPNVPEVITQDEFTHDVILPHANVFLVYDTT